MYYFIIIVIIIINTCAYDQIWHDNVVNGDIYIYNIINKK